MKHLMMSITQHTCDENVTVSPPPNISTKAISVIIQRSVHKLYFPPNGGNRTTTLDYAISRGGGFFIFWLPRRPFAGEVTYRVPSLPSLSIMGMSTPMFGQALVVFVGSSSDCIVSQM